MKREKTKNKINTSENFKKALPFLLTIFITAAVMLVIYAMRSIFPFGTGSIVADDMVQQTIPNYVYFWDWLHGVGDKSLLFSWETAAGAQKMTSGFMILNPLDILFTLVISRNRIVDGMNIYLIVRFVLCACSMLFFLKKTFKINDFWCVCLSLVYTFSAYNLFYYSNMDWIDAAMLLPLVAMSFLYMMNKGKWLVYLLLTSYFAMKSIYLAFMLYIFLLIVGGFYIIFIQDPKTRKAGILRFGLTSVGALLLSAWVTVPSVYYMMNSQRINLKTESTVLGTLLKILNTDTTYSQQKVSLILLCSAILVSFLVILGVNFKKHKKACAFFGLSVLTLVLPVFFENINLIWHLGSYVSFPLRYMYMLIFVGVCAGGYVLENCKDFLNSVKGKKSIALIVPSVLSAVGAIYVLATKVYMFDDFANGLKYNKLLYPNCEKWMFLSMVLLALSYFLIMLLGYKRVACIMTSAIFFAEAFILSDVSLGTNSAKEGRNEMYDLCFVDDSFALSNDLKSDNTFENDNLTRIKDSDVRLNSNYPMLIDYPALSDFTHMASAELTTSMKAMGYSQIYTRVIDNGGTPLTDAILNIKNTFTNKSVSKTEYTFIKNIGDSKLYNNNFTLPFGMTVDEKFVKTDPLEIKNPFDFNNSVYKILSGDNKNIIDVEKHTMKKDEELVFNVDVTQKRHVYVYVNLDPTLASNRGVLSILVDGKQIDQTYFGGTNNYFYPNNMKNGLIDLGEREKCTIELDFYPIKSMKGDLDIEVGQMDFDKLVSVGKKYENSHADVQTTARSLTAKVSSENGNDYLFLPVSFDEGWVLTVNGENQEITHALGAFMSVKLSKGENKIELKYAPKFLKQGIVISLVTLLAVVVMFIISKKRAIPMEKSDKFLSILEKAYFCLVIFTLIAVYIVPIMFFIKNSF